MEQNIVSGTTKRENVVSRREIELIREIAQLRQDEQGQPLERESLLDYELPPRSQFPTIKKPSVTLKGNHMTFNMACIRLFEGIKYIVPLISRRKKRLAIILCAEEEISSVEWARMNKDNEWVNKSITSADFVKTVFSLMNWNSNSRYNALGRLTDSERGLILVFDLSDASEFPPEYVEYVDAKTGAKKKRQVKLYPEYYREHIGKPYSAYEASRQSSLFEDIVGYDSATSKVTEESQPSVSAENIAATMPDSQLTEGLGDGISG